MQAQQEHDEAKEVFDMLNDQLVTELPQLLDLRVPYFDPSFEAMIRMQSKFAEEGYEKLSGVQRYDSSFRVHFHILTLRPAISLIVSATTTPRAS
jgi:amphiphysin